MHHHTISDVEFRDPSGISAVKTTGVLKRYLLISTLIIVLLLTSIFGYRWWCVGRFIDSTNDAYVGANVTDIAPQVSGIITDIAVSDNQIVKAGDLLIRIDDAPFKIALARAGASVTGAKASLQNLDAMTALQNAVIAEAQADLTAAKAEEILSASDRVRAHDLVATHDGSRQAEDAANAHFDQADAGVVKASAVLAAAQAQLIVIGTQKLQAQATLAGAMADVAAARLNLGYTQLTAPFDGMIRNRSAHIGGYALAGAQLLTIVPLHGLWIDANFKEDQLARIRPGELVRIKADIVPGEKITGVVSGLAPASGQVFSILPAENATGNFTKIVQRVPVRILLNGNAADLGLLRPGLSVTAYVNTK